MKFDRCISSTRGMEEKEKKKWIIIGCKKPSLQKELKNKVI
jgi:hypothetical protein